MITEYDDRYDQEWVSYTELDGRRRLIPKTSNPHQIRRTEETKQQPEKPPVPTRHTTLRQ